MKTLQLVTEPRGRLLPDAPERRSVPSVGEKRIGLASSRASCRYSNDFKRHFCVYLPGNWMNLDKTWQSDGAEERVNL